MANNTDEKIVMGLDIPKSAAQINADIRKLQSQLKQVKISGALDTGSTEKKINAQIASLKSQLKNINLSANVDTKSAEKTGQKLGQAIANSAQKATDNSSVHVDKINSDTQTLTNNMKNLSNAAKEASDNNTNSVRTVDKLSNSLKEQFKEAANSVKQMLSLSSLVKHGFHQVGEAVTELKEVDTILTEIGNDSTLTKNQLAALGNTSFQTAGKYGKSAKNYLSTVQEMTHAGYENPEEMSELSLLAQSAGNMDSATANNYLIASDAAYQLKGNIEELNKVIDGQNNITDHTSMSMIDMALATSESASIAAKYGVQISELSALIAAVNSVTHASGSKTGNALNGLFSNLQDTSNQTVKEALDAVNISMTKMENGSQSLKTPIQLLQELSTAYAGLSKNDSRRADILSAVDGEDTANTLSAILSNWSSYEQMLDLYAQGMGSAAMDAEKTANSWEGSLSRLSNTWTDTIGNIADSDAIVSVINGLNGVLTALNNVTDFLGSAGSIGAGIGLFAGLQNTGKNIQVYAQKNNCFEYALHA